MVTLGHVPCVALRIDTGLKAGRDNLAGILAFVKTHAPWNLAISGCGKPPAALDRQPDGVIFGVPLPSGFLRPGIPAIALDGSPGQFDGTGRRVHHVVCDTAAVASTAVEFLIDRGFTSFAYLEDPGKSAWSRMRGRRFAAELGGRGYACRRLPHAASRAPTALLAALRTLPPRTALLAANDALARTVLDTCRTGSVDIPAELAVMGCDNDEMICENTLPALTSIEPDFVAGGYRAAELLARLMRSGRKDSGMPRQISYGVKRIVERGSCLRLDAQPDRRLIEALDFIRLNASAGIDVPAVADRLGMSRRTAELAFRNVLGRTIGMEIRAQRVETMKRLLDETALTASEVCAHSGYSSESQAKLAFRRLAGCGMRRYRARREKLTLAPNRTGRSDPPGTPRQT